MASAPNQPSLPIFYKGLVPLNAEQHRDFKVRQVETVPHLAREHAVPLTVEEFVQCQRHWPIVFSLGDSPVPLALMALNEGVNVLVDADGRPREARANAYVPAYIRRYPWMLARLDPNREELSLCFDPTTETIGAFEEGTQLIEADGSPTEATKEVLAFCEQFEMAAQRTNQFMKDLLEADLLMEGELAIQVPNVEQPFVYRGFQMVNEEKLRELRGDQLRKFNQNGMLPLLYAHLFSLQNMRELFGLQQQFGLGPVPALQPA